MSTTSLFLRVGRLKLIVKLGLLLFASVLQAADTVQSTEPLVWVVHPKREVLTERVSAVASLSAHRVVKLSAGSSGRVEHILVPAAHFADKNQILLSLQPRLELKAPFKGVVSDWRVKVGEYVTQGAELGVLIDAERLVVNYQLPAYYAARLKLGQTLEIHSRLAAPKLQAQVTYVSPEVDPNTQTLKLRAELDNRDHQLFPGSVVHVFHILGLKEEVLTVPESCVRLRVDGYSVLVHKDGRLEEVSVKKGARIGDRLEICSGIEMQDAIVLNYNLLTKPGARIKAEFWQDTP